jgi:transketolase
MDQRSKYLRTLILRQLSAGRRGHTGSAFSMVEILRVLYDDVLRFDPKKPDWARRDRFILSKGHGCLALYAILADKGFFPFKTLDSFCASDSILGGHPEPHIPGVEWATGSLGHGLSVGVGMAIVIKNHESRITNHEVRSKNNYKNIPNSKFLIHNSSPHIFVLLGDGECDEGSVWEAAMSAGKHKLSNLTVLVDYNKMQSFDRTFTVQDLEPLGDKWKSFGFGVMEVDGHDISVLEKVFTPLPFEKDKPSAIICHTVKGKGIKKIENNPFWHHKSKITDEEVKMLYEELEKY